MRVGLIYIILIPLFGLIYYFSPEFWSAPLSLVQSIYFSVVTVTTLGYGDITPQTEIARALTALESILGIIFIGLFLNSVATAADVRRAERHNQAAKLHLLAQYQEWREDLLHACLCAADNSYSVDYELEKKLVNFEEFRESFSGENINRWYKVLGGMQDNNSIIQDIILLSDLFSQQINTALGKINTENTTSLRILTRVSQESFRRKNLDLFSSDPVKYIGQYMFEILSMWSTVDGKLERDFIEDAITKL